MIKRHFCFTRGFTYIGLLIFIALSGVGLAIVGMSWQQKVRAEKEQQLLFVGNEYRKAIKSYYDASTSGVKTYPPTFQDLLLDKRFPVIKRHLRRLYPDPMTGKQEWGVYKQQGLITAVFSLSEQEPFKVAKFSKDNQGFVGARSYKNWIFGQAGGSMNIVSINNGETLTQPTQNKANQDKEATQLQQPKTDSLGSSEVINTNESTSSSHHRASTRIPLE